MRTRLSFSAALFLSACGADDGGGASATAPTSASATATVTASSTATDGTSGTDAPTSTTTDPGSGSEAPTGSESGDSTTSSSATQTDSFPDDSSTTADDPPPFDDGHVFVVGFNDRMVFEYDANLSLVGSWTHPSFDAAEGPAGMVFDYRGHLVVAAYEEFCIFSAPGVEEVCHPKTTPQRTENVIFDISRNLYTTTSTGGTAEIHKYDGDYTYLTTFDLPTQELTGITCDPAGDLFVASQLPGTASRIYKVDGTTLDPLDMFDVSGDVEGLQYADDDNLLVAIAGGVGIARMAPSSPANTLSTISNPGLLWPVPLTIDASGNIYTGDFEDGTGTAASDLFAFDPLGNIVASVTPSTLHGPFGLVVAGTSLPCGALPPG